MNDLLAKCRWPKLPKKYAQALQDAVDYILQRYHVSGIIVSGTILRGDPDPASDLDIYVINQENFRQRVQKFFYSVPTEIFVNPAHMVQRYFEEEQSNRRPITAHMLASGFVILQLDPVISELREKAEHLLGQPPEAPKNLIPYTYFPALLFEDALDVAGKDLATGQMILGQAVSEMLKFCFVRAGKFIPRQKSLLSELEVIDPATTNLVRSYFEADSYDLKIDLASKIADRTIEKHGFFEWESSIEMIN